MSCGSPMHSTSLISSEVECMRLVMWVKKIRGGGGGGMMALCEGGMGVTLEWGGGQLCYELYMTR